MYNVDLGIFERKKKWNFSDYNKPSNLSNFSVAKDQNGLATIDAQKYVSYQKTQLEIQTEKDPLGGPRQRWMDTLDRYLIRIDSSYNSILESDVEISGEKS